MKIDSRMCLHSWAFRCASWLFNQFETTAAGEAPFEMIMGRSYRGKVVLWGSTVICKELPKIKGKGEMWTKGIFVGKDHLSNVSLIRKSRGVVKAKTMRRCANQYQAEALLNGRGTPWDLTLDAILGKKRQGTTS